LIQLHKLAKCIEDAHDETMAQEQHPAQIEQESLVAFPPEMMTMEHSNIHQPIED
jgi:hypothetical protein